MKKSLIGLLIGAFIGLVISFIMSLSDSSWHFPSGLWLITICVTSFFGYLIGNGLK
jgi:hypothetical protein